MNLRTMLLRAYDIVEGQFIRFDKKLVRRTKNLRLVPSIADRRGGQRAYGEWCCFIGIFQSLLHLHLARKHDNEILDIGCGTGILGIAAEPFIGDNGHYTGIDVSKQCIEFCKRHYPADSFRFQHLDYVNALYAPQQIEEVKKWDVADESIDMVTALSVWTHLQEDDAVFFFSEIDRVLKPKGKAIVTFFLLDSCYYNSLEARSNEPGKYHNTPQDRWIFGIPCSESRDWFYPQWVAQPEEAIGVTPSGIQTLLMDTKLSLIETYVGNWKEVPGVFFQDILVFAKE